MPRMHLTDLTVHRLPPAPNPTTYFDTSLPGFGVRVGVRTKTFVVMVGTKARRRVSLGTYPATTLSVARHKARALLLEPTAVPTAISFLEAYRTYLDVYIRPNYRVRSAKNVERVLSRHLTRFTSMKLGAHPWQRRRAF